MSCKTAYPRKMLRRVSDVKKKKLSIGNSDKTSLDCNSDLVIDSELEAVKDSQTQLNDHRDLFGDILPTNTVKKIETENKPIKKIPVTKKKKQPPKEVINSPIIRPQRVFIPNRKVIKIMEEAQEELYNLMGIPTSSKRDVSVKTANFNASGIQNVQNSPLTSVRNESKTNANNNDTNSQKILEGVVGFVDYNFENDRSGSTIIKRLLDLGAKVENTFSEKVTHVVFFEGLHCTYDKAIERNVPLVTAGWVEKCAIANKVLDPVNYPAVGIEMYKKPLEKKKYLDIPDYSCKNDILNILSEKLHTVLNKSDSPVPDDQVDELCIPISIKLLRKYLTPNGKANTIRTELDSELAKIENRLNLNYQARKRFRQLLFPSDKVSNNISNITDFPSTLPQILKISASSRSTSTRKKKTVIDTKLLPNTIKLGKNKRKNNQSNLLKCGINSDLCPKKIRKLTVQDTASSMTSRNSSKIFQTPKASLGSPIVLQSIACTGLTKNEVNILKLSILYLGYNFHTKVEPLTTYLVTKPQSNQTLNTIFAMAYGCFIVSEDWVHESFKVGRWLSHKQYLISDLSEPIKEFQIRRHTLGSSLTFHVFDKVGRIFISDTSESPAKQLRQLVRTCGGHCTNIETKADVVVGYSQQTNNNIHEKWILDSITQGTLLNKDQYMLTNTNK